MLGGLDGGIDQPVGVVGKAQDPGVWKAVFEQMPEQMNLLRTVRKTFVRGGFTHPRVLWVGTQAMDGDDPVRGCQPSGPCSSGARASYSNFASGGLEMTRIPSGRDS